MPVATYRIEHNHAYIYIDIYIYDDIFIIIFLSVLVCLHIPKQWITTSVTIVWFEGEISCINLFISFV